MMTFGVQQEWLERKFPSPREWSWVSRKDFRSTRWDEDADDERDGLVDWARTGEGFRRLIKRLEDPNVDGGGLAEQGDGGILVAGIGKTGYDVSKKSEPWRRGYYTVLMGAGIAAEHLDGWVRDKTRNVAFPSNVVIGPSNPNPQPVPPGAKSAPREEDCEPAFEAPETYYMRILTTKGFSEKQKMDAALACAAWWDFKNVPAAAFEMYKWALDIATANSPQSIVDPATGVINSGKGAPSENILSATTALAVHYAVNSDLNSALPIFLSILRARKLLPNAPSTKGSASSEQEESGMVRAVMSMIKSALIPPPYPPSPSDGTTPPFRNSKELCEEAGIMTYVGEILYASKTSKTSKEDGLAWTREAVDIAEEELRGNRVDQEGKKTCKQCLEIGLGNWAAMVSQLAKEERESREQNAKGISWLSFGGEAPKEIAGRWESEEQVVKERTRRASEVLTDPGKSSGSWLFV